MKQSRLCSIIKICEYLESASEEEALEVIEWIKEELGCKKINEFLIKALTKSEGLFTNDALINLSNKTNLNNTDINIKLKKNNYNQNKTNIEKNRKIKHLPLLKLPSELISCIALLLNEDDLVYFERCNRMVYKTINNSVFLQKCRNFKKFQLTNAMLEGLKSGRMDCYKYSFANEFNFRLVDLSDKKYNYWQLMRNKFKSMLFYGTDSYKYHSNWLTSLFKSIIKMDINFGGMILLDLLPIELLFDKNNSKLSRLSMNQYHEKHVRFDLFCKKYLNYFNHNFNQNDHENANENEKSKHVQLHLLSELHEAKILDTLTLYGGKDSYDDFGMSILMDKTDKYGVLDMIHLDLEDFIVDCQSLTKFSPHLKRLTLTHCHLIGCSGSSGSSSGSDSGSGSGGNVSIDTLRLISIGNQQLEDILFEASFINRMNFHSNLKNLTIEITSPHSDDHENMGYLSSIFKKEDLFKLENVNILFSTWSNDNGWIDNFFDILDKNIKHLKHQFKQLNFGIAVHSTHNAYSFFSWDSKMTIQLITNQRKQWKSLRCEKRSYIHDCQRAEIMYKRFAQQWV